MKIVEKKFNRLEKDWQWGNFSFCDQEFRQIFDIPDGIERVWISLHNKPSANRLVCKVASYDRIVLGSFPVLKVMNGKQALLQFDDPLLDKILKSFVGKKLYLQCEFYPKETK